MSVSIDQPIRHHAPHTPPAHRFCVAPMLDLTDRHCRYFHRTLTRHALLYTEMVTTGALIYGKGDYLAFSDEENPLALQLGGSDPGELAYCARLAELRGYQQINLNLGCPSDRVQNGRFGACLMADAPTVTGCIAAMRTAVKLPVTVKMRIGIDEHDSYAFLVDFVGEITEQGGCDTLIVHARKAWLSGLSPRQNREIPPLDYPRVWRLKQDFPHLTIIINGGIKTVAEARHHLQYVDGVMLGREVYQHPALLLQVDQQIYQDHHAILDSASVVRAMYPYIERELAKGTRLNHITRHMITLFQHCPGARQWRRYLSENAHKAGADCRVVEQALNQVIHAA